jgi:RNA polymerase sigma-70 factor (ECF subfamily)
MSNALADLVLDQAGSDAPLVDRTSLENRLRDALKAARVAWAEIQVPEEVFVRYLAERITGEPDPVEALARLCVEDLLLACACAQNQPGAIECFEARILCAVPLAIRRIDDSSAFIEEVKQRTRLRLLVAEQGKSPRIASYQGRGKLRSWVQVAAVRIALELCRRSHPRDVTDDELLDSPEFSDDPELGHIRTMYRKEFSDAFKEALGALSARERNILRMYLLDGLNIAEIGAIYRVHRATVARWIAKYREMLLVETRNRLVQKLRISESQFQSLMVVVRSHLELSLERFLNVDKK